MSALLTWTIIIGVTLAVGAFFALLTLPKKGPRPPSYKLPEEWTHGPLLWAATEEKIGSAGHGHGAEFTVGGGASGKW
ncbi:hypothetical protein MCHIJ_30590 [Mycolicibacterium chitae]|uniref:Uncharacterized protein n=1 Tax=Mycolicibacterium chitae TaxID=1792 RepID=A0A3S4RFU6_MYCCI|nr:hypothetical protein MCHIJ_30590 [Mycolicibacterium chitae]VEG47277.1 Uncharacterised protein [Mycolicibacterium chitae]